MLKIIGVLSVFLVVPVLGMDAEELPCDPSPITVGLTASFPKYTQEEALTIARELYGESSCSNCGRQNDVVLSELLVLQPKITVDHFKERALEIKGAIDLEQPCLTTMVDQLACILALGGSTEVDAAMEIFRTKQGSHEFFSKHDAAHLEVLKAFTSKIQSLHVLATSASLK